MLVKELKRLDKPAPAAVIIELLGVDGVFDVDDAAGLGSLFSFFGDDDMLMSRL